MHPGSRSGVRASEKTEIPEVWSGAAGKPSLFLEPTGTASFSILVSVSPRGSPVWNWRLLGPAVGL